MLDQFTLVTAGIAAFLAVMIWLLRAKPKTASAPIAATPDNAPEPVPVQAKIKKEKSAPVKVKAAKHVRPDHALYAHALHGHTAAITDLQVTPNSKYLASSSEDRSVRLWKLADILDEHPANVRVPIEYDYASHISFTTDSRFMVAALGGSDVVRVFKLEKGESTVVINFPEASTLVPMFSL